MNYYKILNEDRTPCNGGRGKWKPVGQWMPEVGVIPCQSGYHVCEVGDVLAWAGPALWEVEIDGTIVRHGDKTVASRARLVRRVHEWNDKNLRLFAADCAENVLDIYCKANPEDGGMALMFAIQTARDFANGKADVDDLAAAWDAARAAARAAALAAARSAEKQWQTQRLCEYLEIEL